MYMRSPEKKCVPPGTPDLQWHELDDGNDGEDHYCGTHEIPVFYCLCHVTYTVTFTVDGQTHRSTVHKNDLTVLVAGICLSGEDRKFDLQSLVGVIREGSQRRQLVRMDEEDEFY